MAASTEPAYLEEEEEQEKRPGKPCDGSRRDLIKCLKESDCIKVRR